MHTRRSGMALAALVALAAAVPAACGARTGQPEAPYATLAVRNSSTLTVNVFAVIQSVRYRLGTVAATGRAEFELHRRMLSSGGELRIMVDPLGSDRRYYSDRIVVVEGDIVEVDVSSFIR